MRVWRLLLGVEAENLDDIGAAVLVCRYGRDGDSAAQAWVGGLAMAMEEVGKAAYAR